MVDKLLLNIEEAAEAMNIRRSKLYELMAAGEIETIKVGARRLVPSDALVTFIARLRSASLSQPKPSGRTTEAGPKAGPDTITLTDALPRKRGHGHHT